VLIASPSSHYQLVQLTLNQSIEVGTDKLVVDLDRADWTKRISNDREFIDSRNIDSRNAVKSYFWVSGGGTYVINNRYLVLVKRSDWAKVNPGKFSLFTGRADSRQEMIDPRLLVRELFEELVLMSGNSLYYPIYADYQDAIAQIYQDLVHKFSLQSYDHINLQLEPIENFDRQVSIKHQGRWNELNLDFHISIKRDINILFCFKIDLDISDLVAIDCEYHFTDQQDDTCPTEIVKHNRSIYLYDLFAGEARKISISDPINYQVSDRKESLTILKTQMTEHLLHMIRLLQTNLIMINKP
jgi:hypothetical protein